MTIKEINEKFVSGKEGITDGELCGLLNYYKQLHELADTLDSDYNLFKRDIYRRYDLLKSFDEARKIF